MRSILCAILTAACLCTAKGQTASQPAADPLAPLRFLLGTWAAETAALNAGAAATAAGTYTFSRDLAGHALQRTATVATCKGAQAFDCNHHDQLTIFPDPNALAAHGTSLLALYLDNEGHVIYYAITLPDPHTAVFLSQGPSGAPKFRLTYHLEGTAARPVMTGKFQMAAPGSDEFHSYLEWSGTKR